MGSSQSAPKKVTFEKKGDATIEVTQEAFDLMTGKKRAEDKIDENKPPKEPKAPKAKPSSSYSSSSDPNYAALIEIEERFQAKMRKLEAAQKRDLEKEKAALESAVKELEAKLQSSTIASGGVCRDAQDAIIECYRANPKQPLNCAKLIEKFSKCVNDERWRLLGAGAAPPPPSS